MNTKSYFLASICFSIVVSATCQAQSIPAGTTLTVRTINSISSHQRVGRQFKAEISQDVTVNGRVVLRAGTPATGVVEEAVGDFKKSNALKLNLKSITVDGRTVSVKTTGGFEPAVAGSHQTRGGATVYGRDYTFPHGTQLQFRLAQPLNI